MHPKTLTRTKEWATEGSGGPPVWIATVAGAGYCPIAPGTAGSAVAIVLIAGLAQIPLEQPWPSVILAVIGAGIFAIGVWAAGKAEKHFGRVDPGQVVIDEVVGQIIAFLGRPHASWKWLLAGFLFFRVFDVIKPFPARRAEHLPGGWGIMVDDVIAGAYSLAALTILGQFWK